MFAFRPSQKTPSTNAGQKKAQLLAALFLFSLWEITAWDQLLVRQLSA